MQFGSEITALHLSKSGASQDNVHCFILYLLYTADLPTDENTVTTFADDSAILGSN